MVSFSRPCSAAPALAASTQGALNTAAPKAGLVPRNRNKPQFSSPLMSEFSPSQEGRRGRVCGGVCVRVHTHTCTCMCVHTSACLCLCFHITCSIFQAACVWLHTDCLLFFQRTVCSLDEGLLARNGISFALTPAPSAVSHSLHTSLGPVKGIGKAERQGS